MAGSRLVRRTPSRDLSESISGTWARSRLSSSAEAAGAVGDPLKNRSRVAGVCEQGAWKPAGPIRENPPGGGSLPVARVGSAVAARGGEMPTSPPWPHQNLSPQAPPFNIKTGSKDSRWSGEDYAELFPPEVFLPHRAINMVSKIDNGVHLTLEAYGGRSSFM